MIRRGLLSNQAFHLPHYRMKRHNIYETLKCGSEVKIKDIDRLLDSPISVEIMYLVGRYVVSAHAGHHSE